MMKIKLATLTIWTVALLAFPLVALTGSTENKFFGYFSLEYLPILAICLAFLVSATRTPSYLSFSVGAAVVFCGLAYGSLFLAFSPIYQPDKLNQFLLVILIFGILLGTCLQERMFLERLPIALLCVGGIAFFLFALNPSVHQEGRATFGEGNPIWMGRTLSLLGVAAIWLIIQEKRWAWGLLLISFATITLTGSRGPLLSLAVAAGYGLTLLQRRGGFQTAIIIGAAILMLILVQIGFDVIPQLRALDYASGSGREALYRYTISLIIVSPRGLGVGNFYAGFFSYPHNIFLEFLVEWGWFLGGIIIGAICWGGYRLLRMPAKFDILKLTFVVEILNSQFSGDITTPRMLYALVFVGLISKVVRLKDINDLRHYSRKVDRERAYAQAPTKM